MSSEYSGRFCGLHGLGDGQGETKFAPEPGESVTVKCGNRGSRSKVADWLSLSCLYLLLTES